MLLNHKIKFKDYNLNSPESKKNYNDQIFQIIAPKYDLITRILSFGRDRSWKKIFSRMLPPLENPRCLDLACGTGDIIRILLDRYPDAYITGLDLNAHMIDYGKKRIRQTNVSFILGDMNDTKEESAHFDLITGSYALRNSPELTRTFQEIYRILKPGGYAVFLDFAKYHNRFLQIIQYGLLKVWGSIWGMIFHHNHEIYAYIAESLQLFPHFKELKRMLNNTGFKDIKRKILFAGIINIVYFRK